MASMCGCGLLLFNRYHSCVDAFVSKDFKEENYLVYYIPSLLQARLLSLDK